MKNKEIQEIIERILEVMDISGEVEITEEEAIKTRRFHIKTEQAHLLIGNQGAHLAALSHIVRKIVEKKLGDGAKEGFILDVDDYQGKKIAELKQQVALLAERAQYFKIDVEMDPMPPYERMMVHAILSSTPGIKTESTGEGKMRRVVVRYVDEAI